MSGKFIAGHELTPGKAVKDHIHVEGTELHGSVVIVLLVNRFGFLKTAPCSGL